MRAPLLKAFGRLDRRGGPRGARAPPGGDDTFFLPKKSVDGAGRKQRADYM